MCEGEFPWKAVLTSSAFLQPRPSGGADVANDEEEKQQRQQRLFYQRPTMGHSSGLPEQERCLERQQRGAHTEI